MRLWISGPQLLVEITILVKEDKGISPSGLRLQLQTRFHYSPIVFEISYTSTLFLLNSGNKKRKALILLWKRGCLSAFDTITQIDRIFRIPYLSIAPWIL